MKEQSLQEGEAMHFNITLSLTKVSNNFTDNQNKIVMSYPDNMEIKLKTISQSERTEHGF